MKILMTRTRHENNAQICAAAKTESKNNNSQESQKTETESPNNNSQENQKTASPTAATRSKTPPNDTKDHQGDVRAYTTYQDTKIYHNLHTASVITVTGMYINDDVYIAPASSDVLPFTHEPVPLQEEQLRTSSPEDLTE